MALGATTFQRPKDDLGSLVECSDHGTIIKFDDILYNCHICILVDSSVTEHFINLSTANDRMLLLRLATLEITLVSDLPNDIEIALGRPWLVSLGLIFWDFAASSMSFLYEGQHIWLTGLNSVFPQSHPLPLELMDTVLWVESRELAILTPAASPHHIPLAVIKGSSGPTDLSYTNFGIYSELHRYTLANPELLRLMTDMKVGTIASAWNIPIDLLCFDGRHVPASSPLLSQLLTTFLTDGEESMLHHVAIELLEPIIFAAVLFLQELPHSTMDSVDVLCHDLLEHELLQIGQESFDATFLPASSTEKRILYGHYFNLLEDYSQLHDALLMLINGFLLSSTVDRHLHFNLPANATSFALNFGVPQDFIDMAGTLDVRGPATR